MLMPHRVIVHNDANLTCPDQPLAPHEPKDALSISLLDKNEKLTEKYFECQKDLVYEKIKNSERNYSSYAE